MTLSRLARPLGVALGTAWIWALAGPGCAPDTTTALGPTEVCDNGIDDDGDGKIDCEDPDCAGHYFCDDAWVERLCANGVDDDGDGKTDCEDPDCAGDQACNPDREVACADGVDNDGDGLVDCNDPDCASAPACQERCADGVDNDGDGLVDCEDPDCAGQPGCLREACGNGLDDDGDGLVDCDDPDCQDTPDCAIPPVRERCDDGVDNDGDGLVDCDDPDCEGSPWCVEGVCDDGWDNDLDGWIDCEDPDCQGTPACTLDPTCQRATTLYCGSALWDTTYGRPNSFSTYPCMTSLTLQGGESVYRYTNPSNATETIRFRLYPWDPFTEFVIVGLHGTQSGCTLGAECLPLQISSDGLDVQATVPAGATIYLVVDSVQALGGDFDLELECPTVAHEICTNGSDDDNDGKIDCWDPDCLNQPGCDYWVSAGVRCNPAQSTTCAPGEYCSHITVNGTTSQYGICTKDCASPGLPSPECWNPEFTTGACVPGSQGTGMCVMRCGSLVPGGTECPEGTLCTNPANGGTVNVQNGICAPVSP